MLFLKSESFMLRLMNLCSVANALQCGVIVLAQSHNFLQKFCILDIVMQEALSQFQPKNKDEVKPKKKKR